MGIKSKDTTKKIDSIRKKTFGGKYALDLKLIEYGKSYSPIEFLSNPTGQNVYLYLTQFVYALVNDYFRSGTKQIKVLDWGCGKGHASFLMKKLGLNVMSADIIKELTPHWDSSFSDISPILQNEPIDIIPLEHDWILPFEDCSIDVVCSFGVWEHVKDDFNSLLEIRRILKTDGLFICFFLPYHFSWRQRMLKMGGYEYHERLYTKNKVKQKLQKANFHLLKIWHRQLFPKYKIIYPKYLFFERVDQFLCEYTPLKFLSTSIEFIARK